MNNALCNYVKTFTSRITSVNEKIGSNNIHQAKFIRYTPEIQYNIYGKLQIN